MTLLAVLVLGGCGSVSATSKSDLQHPPGGHSKVYDDGWGVGRALYDALTWPGCEMNAEAIKAGDATRASGPLFRAQGEQDDWIKGCNDGADAGRLSDELSN